MGILSNWHKRGQRKQFPCSTSQHIDSDSDSVRRSRRSGDIKSVGFGLLRSTELQNNKSRRGVSVHSNVSRSGDLKSNCHPKSHRGDKRHGHYKYLYPVVLCLTNLATAPATLAEGVGGVSATANPIANSSGSVTNQAIQVLQGPYVTNTYGNGISCQGPTLNMTPYITHAQSKKDPFESMYFEPQYDMTDYEGRLVEVQKNVKNYPWESWYDTRTKEDGTRWFEDGADMTITVMEMQGDGIPDNPGSEIWRKPVRTGQKDNYSTSIGLSATLSIPLDGGLQNRCKQAADTQIGLQQQLTANKRLDFEIARLKNCGELKKAGIYFRPGTKYAAICADVMVDGIDAIRPHRHAIPQPISSAGGGQTSTSGSLGSVPAARPAEQTKIVPGSSSSVLQRSSSQSSSLQVSPLSTEDQREVLRAVQKSSQLQQLKR